MTKARTLHIIRHIIVVAEQYSFALECKITLQTNTCLYTLFYKMCACVYVTNDTGCLRYNIRLCDVNIYIIYRFEHEARERFHISPSYSVRASFVRVSEYACSPRVQNTYTRNIFIFKKHYCGISAVRKRSPRICHKTS